MFFFGAGLGLIMPLINTMGTDAVHREYIGAATSLYNSFTFVGQSSSPLLLGLVFKWFGLGAAFWTAGTAALLGAAGIMVFKKR
ncbi:hypothetical protein MFMK1_001598 [Metallumcola ferriviriculae]|uniref:Major facilitator superfamily (MFS) profile domain-containing protein n=1 Tax=Metallumcola ferriviriculae TaxID=3039180 RepID=A0AAU0UMJ4_9FIRM|nr:hypothetical protein MFMK1_001598 [Desulfitibacteraceae bacterium MK1]